MIHVTSVDFFEKIFNANKNILVLSANKDNSLINGIIVIIDNKEAKFWQGGVPISKEYKGSTELLHWECIKFLKENTRVEYYDFVGANVKRIAEHKSKFNSDLHIYFEIEKNKKIMSLILMIYRFFYDK